MLTSSAYEISHIWSFLGNSVYHYLFAHFIWDLASVFELVNCWATSDTVTIAH